MPQRVVTVSDLHLGAASANAFREWPRMRELLEGADVCVINGDFADYSQSLWDTERVEEHARGWLAPLLMDFPQCRFVVIPGNHDDTRNLSALCERMNRQFDNVTFCADGYLRIGEILWTHGHLGGRDDWSHIALGAPGEIAEPYSTKLAHMPFNCMPGTVSRFAFPLDKVMSQVTQWLHENAADDLHEARHIVIGHVHEPDGITDHPMGEHTWHVTGCSAHGAPTHIWECILNDDGCLMQHRLHRSTHPGVWDTLQRAILDLTRREKSTQLTGELA